MAEWSDRTAGRTATLLVAARSIVRCFAALWCSICAKMRWQLGGPAVRCVSRSDTQRSPILPMPMVVPYCPSEGSQVGHGGWP